jgi:hypothetical protein
MMDAIRAGQIFALYLFDVAEAIDLNLAAARVSGGTRARLAPKAPTPQYFQYQEPPILFDGHAIEGTPLEGFHAVVRVFDYGIVALRLSQPFAGTWSDLAATAQAFVENEKLERHAEQACRSLAGRLGDALKAPRQTLLSEDYVVFAVNELDQPESAVDLLSAHGDVIAQLLRGESAPLSAQERDEVLSNRISYLADDLAIPTWNSAFVYDTPAGAEAAVEICEFANSQLLQFRYYDELLDNELARIYADIQRKRWYDWIGGRHYSRAARHVHALFIDVNELTDRTENALKIVGDVYAARLFSMVGARLDLSRWKTNVGEKLTTLDDIYRFLVERISMSRGQFLELTVVIILVLELVMLFAGVRGSG